MKQHLELLGLHVRDRVTNVEGIVTTISFDLYGCIQAVVHPGQDKDGKLRDQHWFDINRLKVLDWAPVMDRPNFEATIIANGEKGAAEKPLSGKA